MNLQILVLGLHVSKKWCRKPKVSNEDCWCVTKKERSIKEKSSEPVQSYNDLVWLYHGL